jgi:FKBP-type peptidyl-prolyl cis-trans isomerase FkpA
MKRFLGLALLVVVALASCKKETRDLKQIEDEQIQAYIKSNNLSGFIKDTSGFYYQILSVGSGEQLKYSSYIGVSQKTISINASLEYEFSKYNPQFNYLGYITPISWRETLLKVKKGGEVRVLTPSYLAFGKNGSGSTIPGNAILDTKMSVINDADRATYEDGLIKTFLAENNITALKNSNGIYYQIITAGTGTSVTSAGATIKVAYTGRLLTGSIFDQALIASPLSIVLSSTIEGWKIGVPLIKAGGKMRLFIPSSYGYGTSAAGSIPANSVLDFDIELVEVTN